MRALELGRVRGQDNGFRSGKWLQDQPTHWARQIQDLENLTYQSNSFFQYIRITQRNNFQRKDGCDTDSCPRSILFIIKLYFIYGLGVVKSN